LSISWTVKNTVVSAAFQENYLATIACNIYIVPCN